MSASDCKHECKDFVLENNPRSPPTHFFRTMEDQIANAPCALHPQTDKCIAAPVEPDFSISGTPCHPFSVQRRGRYDTGSVQGHGEYDTTMSSIIQWLNVFRPRIHLLEQVQGFSRPLDKNTTETPMSRLDLETWTHH